MTTDPDVDEQWHPGQILEPGRPCPPHLDRAMRQAIADALAAHDERTRLHRERQETK